MATRNPMENYLKGERELPFEELFLAPEKKPFYKKAARYIAPVLTGITIFSGIPQWDAPKHVPKQNIKQDGIVYTLKSAPKSLQKLLKVAKAWAEDGVSVYVEDFTEGSQRDPPAMYNMGSSFSKELKINLSNKGVNVVEGSDDGITIFGHCTEISDPIKGHLIRVNFGYKVNGKSIDGFGGSDYFNSSQYNDKIWEITNFIYNELMRLSSRGGYKRQTKTEGNKWQEIELGPNAKKMLGDPQFRHLVIKSFESDGYKVEGNRVFKPIQK
jgi:hypothetical protein